ncbi:Cell division control 6-like protein B [Nymphaea thermarum]|nr:Cell division control 6-like protein B [Nymphaea thermarum]
MARQSKGIGSPASTPRSGQKSQRNSPSSSTAAHATGPDSGLQSTPTRKRGRPDSTPPSTRQRFASPKSTPCQTPLSCSGGRRNGGPGTPTKVDCSHLNAVKEALHVSTVPADLTCREEEQEQVLGFCKKCIQQEKSGSLYVSGSPGTGKSLVMEKVKCLAADWAKEKVAAVSGDMRKALDSCRLAVETLEAELHSATNLTVVSSQMTSTAQLMPLSIEGLPSHESDLVRIDHMANALSKTFKSPVVSTIQSLPLHQQMILCSAVKSSSIKRNISEPELYKSYSELARSKKMSPASILEFASISGLLAEQGLIKFGKSRNDKFRMLTLQVDTTDVIFALQVSNNCLHRLVGPCYSSPELKPSQETLTRVSIVRKSV